MIGGHVQNGVVILDAPGAVQEGDAVVVKVVAGATPKKRSTKPTVHRALANLAGKAEGLPPDASENIDCYLYGHAQR